MHSQARLEPHKVKKIKIIITHSSELIISVEFWRD